MVAVSTAEWSSLLADAHRRDILTNRPASAIAGRLFYAIDTQLLYRDNGSGWDTLTIGSGGGSSALTYSQIVLQDSPVLYWRCADTSGTTVADSSGNGNTGTYNGTVTLGQTGFLADGNAAVLLGTSAYISGTVSSLPTGGSARTVELLLKTTQSSISSSVPIAYGTEGSTGELIEIYFPNAQQMQFTQWGGNTGTYNIARINDGNWHHLACTVDGSGVAELYYDGAYLGAGSPSGGINTVGTTLYVGRAVGGSGTLSGTYDEIAVYGTRLPAGRIMAHYLAIKNLII